MGSVGDPAAWVHELERFDLDSARVLKRDGEDRVVAAELMGRRVVIKVRPLRGFFARVRARLGLSREHRQWRGARLLQASFLPTPAPMALAIVREPHGPVSQLLVLEEAPGRTLLHHLADREAAGIRHAIASEVGRLLGLLTAARITNRDAKPSNWMVSAAPFAVAMIDTVGVRYRAEQGPDPAMLATLVIEPIGTGCLPGRTVLWRGLRSYEAARTATGSGRVPRTDLKALWRSVATLVAEHGDPTPRVDPLGRAPAQRGR